MEEISWRHTVCPGMVHVLLLRPKPWDCFADLVDTDHMLCAASQHGVAVQKSMIVEAGGDRPTTPLQHPSTVAIFTGE